MTPVQADCLLQLLMPSLGFGVRVGKGGLRVLKLKGTVGRLAPSLPAAGCSLCTQDTGPHTSM